MGGLRDTQSADQHLQRQGDSAAKDATLYSAKLSTCGSRALLKASGSSASLTTASCRPDALLTAQVTPSRTGLHSHCGTLCIHTRSLDHGHTPRPGSYKGYPYACGQQGKGCISNGHTWRACSIWPATPALWVWPGIATAMANVVASSWACWAVSARKR